MTKSIRKLAAIMFTDIVGYTALSAKDEEKALVLIDKQREVLKPLVENFGGNWLKEIGDGLLISFPSSKQAVNCAIKIQQTVKEIEDLNLRIGIHQGDILEKDGDVFGDDVNIASRIEPFAAVGGVAISDKVHRDISGSPEITTKYLGQPKLKGVTQEVKVYCITSHGLPDTKMADVSAKLERKSQTWMKGVIPAIIILAAAIYYFIPKEQEIPSIGILYIENLGSEEDEFWARGITEDVIIEVASAGLIRVTPMIEILEFMESNLPLVEISKKLHVKYLLTSSIHKKEDGFDLRSQLIEAESGKSIYAKKWSESLEKANTITGTLAENILSKLGVSTKQNISKPYTTNPEAYEFYLKGKYRFEKRENMEDTEIARGLLQKSLEIDNNLIEAKIQLGWSYIFTNEYDIALKYFHESMQTAEEFYNQAREAEVLRKIGSVHQLRGDYEEAQKYTKHSLEIAREIGDRSLESAACNELGSNYWFMGKMELALTYYNQAILIEKEIGNQRGIGIAIGNVVWVYQQIGDYDKALNLIEQSQLIFHELEDKLAYDNQRRTIGFTYLFKGNYKSAFDECAQSLFVNKNIGNKWATGQSYNCMGQALYQLGDYSKSAVYFDSSYSIWSELTHAHEMLYTLSWKALANLKAGDIAIVEVLVNEIELMIESSDSEVNLSPWILSQIYSGLGKSDKAVQYLNIKYESIMTKANSFQDKKFRKSFLTNIRENREVVAAWEKLNK